jgi:DNA primase
MNTSFYSCEEAKKIDLVEYLERLGFKPDRVRHNQYWYHSPLRLEKTPSFKVNRLLNVWYDHGIGKGGNIIDFGMLYYKCSIPELLRKLSDDFSFHQPALATNKNLSFEKESVVRITSVAEVNDPWLQNYLRERCIPLALANQYCKQIHYEFNQREFTAIGFQNNSGGYELRNPFFKGSTAPKDVRFIDNGVKEISVFEGFFDFLSLLVIAEKDKQCMTNFLVLNSLAFFERSRQKLEQHEKIHLYFDRDPAGMKHTQDALERDLRFIDKSALYEKHKDLNEYLVHKSQVRKVIQKLRKHL